MICSDCFHNEGLRLEARKIGVASEEICENCGATSGRKITTTEQVRLLMQNFFMHGSVPQDIGGWAPVYWWTDRIERDDTTFDDTLRGDYELIKEKLGVCVFQHSPPLWRLGYTYQYEELEKNHPEKALSFVISAGKEQIIRKGQKIYRIRTNPTSIYENGAFDTPPLHLKKECSRFDTEHLEVFYGALDIETCLHECRVTLVDEVALATFEAAQDIRVLNLFDGIEQPPGSDRTWESVEILMYKLCHSSVKEYPKCRQLAEAVLHAGYEGMIVRSYYSQVEEVALPNVLLFGHPESDGKIGLHSLNRVKLDRVEYSFTLGPL
jgi:hypothetical protein